MAARQVGEVSMVGGQDDGVTESDRDRDDQGVDRRRRSGRAEKFAGPSAVFLERRDDLADRSDDPVHGCVGGLAAHRLGQDDRRDANLDACLPRGGEDCSRAGIVTGQADDGPLRSG